jgi:hypothetical protein
MALGQGVVWRRGPSELARALETEYKRRAVLAVKAMLLHFAPQMEKQVKQAPDAGGAPWTDRTGNARQSLFAVVGKPAEAGNAVEPIDELADDIVALYLSHGMEYGKWLELCNSGKYAVIMPTLEAYYPQISAAMRELFR